MRKFTESVESDNMVLKIKDILVDFSDNGYGVTVSAKKEDLFYVKLVDNQKTFKGNDLFESISDINNKIEKTLGLNLYNYSISLESDDNILSNIQIFYSLNTEINHSLVTDYRSFVDFLKKRDYEESDDDDYNITDGILFRLSRDGFFIDDEDMVNYDYDQEDYQELFDYLDKLNKSIIPYTKAEEIFYKIVELGDN